MGSVARNRMVCLAALVLVGLMAACEEKAAGPAPEPKPEPEAEEPLEWERPRFAEFATARRNMVKEQMAPPQRGRSAVKDEAVLEAMREVPRHRFVPGRQARSAHGDSPLGIGHGQTISQPYIVAFMTEMLQVKPGHRVLEIGTGSAYQAAVLSELTPHVYSIEIIKELAVEARKRLDELGYKTVTTKQGDGYYGWEEHAPFDAIIVTAAAGHVPPPLMGQLKPGGRLVIPVGSVNETQHLVLITKDDEGNLKTKNVLPVRFVPMTGRVRSTERRRRR